jgi:hypothetical protein
MIIGEEIGGMGKVREMEKIREMGEVREIRCIANCCCW